MVDVERQILQRVRDARTAVGAVEEAVVVGVGQGGVGAERLLGVVRAAVPVGVSAIAGDDRLGRDAALIQPDGEPSLVIITMSSSLYDSPAGSE
jgi:hypothetical protein